MTHRHRTRLWTLFAALALGLVVLPTGLASATVGLMQVSVDTTLTEDHNGQIQITADNVALDCDGHRIYAEGEYVEGYDGVGLEGVSGVTVRNCVIEGFYVGVSLADAFGNTIKGNDLVDNYIAIWAFDGSHSNVIEGNDVVGDRGIWLDGNETTTTYGNVVSGNTVSGAEEGFQFRYMHNSKISGNHAIGSNGPGVQLGDWSSGNELVGNTIVDGNADGITVVTDATMNVVSGNLIQGNAGVGIVVKERSTSNTIINNRIRDHELGFAAQEESPNNTVESNWFCRNDRPWWNNEDSATEYIDNKVCGVGLVDPSSGEWHLRHSEDDIDSFYYGNPGDVPFMGDWNCNDEATPGLFRQSDAFAYLRNSNTQGIADIRFFFGNPSDIPLAGDFNGDGCDTLSIYRPSEAKFYIINKLGENEGGLGAAEYSFLFGNQGDKPVVGDWDGDGIDEIGLHRESTGFFYYRNTLTTGIADGQFYFGDPGDRFVAGDWGDVIGADTPAMFRPSNSTFYFRHTLTQGNADSEFVWTGAGSNWSPVSGDFTLD